MLRYFSDYRQYRVCILIYILNESIITALDLICEQNIYLNIALELRVCFIYKLFYCISSMISLKVMLPSSFLIIC